MQDDEETEWVLVEALSHLGKKNKMVASPLKTNMTEQDWEAFSPWLNDMLKMGPVSVTFTKKDGTVRVMNCTLDPTLLPPVTVTEDTEPKKKKAVNENTMAVYDLEAKGWRSFTVRTVSRVEFKL